MKRLSATDALFAYAETSTTPMNMGSVQILALPKGYKGDFFSELKEFIAARLPYVPKLSQRLVVEWVGLPYWQDVEDIDLDYHVRRTRVRSSSPRDIARKLGRLQHTPFDFNKPLFMFYLIEGLDDGRMILVQKFHHAVADGKTAVRMMDLFSDEGLLRAQQIVPDEQPTVSSGRVMRALSGVSQDIGRSWDSFRTLAGLGPALFQKDSKDMMQTLASRPVTIFNQPLSELRQFSTRHWPLERMQRIRRAAGLTYNDFGLVLLAGALRRYLDELDALPESSLLCNVPVALKTEGVSDGNAVLAMWVPIGTQLETTRERAEYVKREAVRAKEVLQGLIDSTASGPGVRLPSLAMRGMALTLSSAQIARLNPPPGNVAMSNVPAPPEQIHVAGAAVESLYGMPMLLQGQALGTTFSSYDDKVVMGLMCDEQAIPDPERILDYVNEEIDNVERAFATATPAKSKQKAKRKARPKAKTTSTRKSPARKAR